MNAGRLLNRNILLLWQGQFVSNLGNQAFLIAMVFWVKDATGSAAMMGLILMLAGLPGVILGPIGGVVADRYSRRNIIVACDLIAGLAVLGLAGLMLLAPAQTGLILGWMIVTATLLAVVSAFFSPAISAAIPDLVPGERVAGANSVSQILIELATLIGQAAGGVLYRVLGAPLLMLFDAASFLFSAASEAMIKIPQRLPERGLSVRTQLAAFRNDMAEGLRYVWGARGLRGLVLISALGNFFNVPIIVLLPFFVEDVLALTPDWYGYLLATYSAGTLGGYLAAGGLGLTGRARARLTMACMFLEPLGYALLAVTRSPVALLPIAGLAGVTSGFLIVTITTVLQTATPSELRGRVFGLLGTISGTLVPIATGLAGVVADLTGQRITLIYLVCSAVMLILSLVISLSPRIRAFLAYEPAPPDAPAPSDEPALTAQGAS